MHFSSICNKNNIKTRLSTEFFCALLCDLHEEGLSFASTIFHHPFSLLIVTLRDYVTVTC